MLINEKYSSHTAHSEQNTATASVPGPKLFKTNHIISLHC